MIEGKNIFITGGGGFIGSHIAERFIEKNNITVYDNEHRDSLKYTNLKENPNMTFINGDILDVNKLKESLDHHDVIIHMAAIAGVGTTLSNPVRTLNVNLLGTNNMLEAAKENGVERFINFSTSEVYGQYAKDAREDDSTSQGPIGDSRWAYAVSKLAGEHLCFSYYKETGLPFVSVRPFNIYGPRQTGGGAINIMVNRAINDKEINVHGNGKQVRAWCYITDMVDAIDLILKNDNSVGKIFNIGNSAAGLTTYELAEKIVELSKSKSEVVFKKIDYVDIEERVPDISTAKDVLGFEPKVALEDGLKMTIEWYKKNQGK